MQQPTHGWRKTIALAALCLSSTALPSMAQTAPGTSDLVYRNQFAAWAAYMADGA